MNDLADPHLRNKRFLALASLVLVHVLGAWALFDLEVQTDITEFMPASEDARLAEMSRALTKSELSRNLTITILGNDLDLVIGATRDFADALSESEQVEWLRYGPAPDMQRAFYELYFEKRFGLVDVDLEETALRERGARLKAQLASPMGTFVRRLAAEDPLLLFLDHVESIQDALAGTLEVHDGVFVSRSVEPQSIPVDSDAPRIAGVVLLSSANSPLDGAASAELLSDIDAAFARVSAHGLHLEYAGVHPIALEAEGAIRSDIQRVSLSGTLGVVLIILLLFRSPRVLILGAMPIAGGMMVALFVTRLIFGSVHGLTLAFGATLIGVALDYVVHFLNHHYLAGERLEEPNAEQSDQRNETTSTGTRKKNIHSAFDSIEEVRAGLILGALTTVAGLLGLAWASFPGIRQMSVFTSVGVLTALVLTLIALPPLMPKHAAPASLHVAFARWLSARLSTLGKRRRLLLLVFPVALAFAGVTLPSLKWEGDMRALNPVSAERQARDEAVRQRVAPMDQGRLAFAQADTLEDALEINDEVANALEAAVENGELDAFRSLSVLLPSARTQLRRIEHIESTSFERIMSAYEEEGFVAAPFTPFSEALAADKEPLVFSELEDSPLEDLARAHLLELESGQIAVLTFVRGVHQPDALAARLNLIEGAGLFDQAAYMSSASRKLQSRTLQLVGAGLVIVMLILLVRYRSPQKALAAFAPAALAAACTLGVFAMLGQEVHLLHIVCLLLVLSMGVDYGVFMVEALEHDSDAIATSFAGVIVACASTFCSFGVLGLSDHPALFAMGATAAIGVLLSLIFAPLATLLVSGRGAKQGA